MKKQIMEIGKRRVSIFSGDATLSGAIVYLHIAADDLEQLVLEMADVNVVLVAIEGVDWNRELSPWPEKRAFKGGADFGGGADIYLPELTTIIVPEVEAEIGFTPSSRVLAGYSLAGMFALYAMYRTTIFNRIGSISGSLWYDGFLEFMTENQPLQIPERLYFSLGDREKINRNHRFSVVEEHTILAEKHMHSLGSATLLELNPGNHFDDATLRIARGLRWILSD